MIGTIVGCASVGALVWFLERISKKSNPKYVIMALKEKRRILERRRAYFQKAWQKSGSERDWDGMYSIDAELIDNAAKLSKLE